MVLVIRAKTVARVLVGVVLLITLASLAVRFLQYIGIGQEFFVLSLFDVGEENNLPTWYSSIQLQLSSVLLATIAIAKRKRGDRYTLHWAVLSFVFLGLSLDEVVTLHEEASGKGSSFAHDLLGLDSGFFYYSWVIYGTVFVLAFVLAYLPFLVHLPGETRRLFVLAGVLFVLGVLGAEMVSARMVSSYGIESWRSMGGLPKIAVGLMVSLEELLEMLGIVVFIYALLSYMSSHLTEATLRFRLDKP
jgi:hypothetical protein